MEGRYDGGAAMSDRAERPIQVGDLVLLLPSPNPNCDPFVGTIRTVKEPSKSFLGHWRLDPRTISRESGLQISWPDIRLKRIPPLSELEGEREWVYIKRPEDIPA